MYRQVSPSVITPVILFTKYTFCCPSSDHSLGVLSKQQTRERTLKLSAWVVVWDRPYLHSLFQGDIWAQSSLETLLKRCPGWAAVLVVLPVVGIEPRTQPGALPGCTSSCLPSTSVSRKCICMVWALGVFLFWNRVLSYCLAPTGLEFTRPGWPRTA